MRGSPGPQREVKSSSDKKSNSSKESVSGEILKFFMGIVRRGVRSSNFNPTRFMSLIGKYDRQLILRIGEPGRLITSRGLSSRGAKSLTRVALISNFLRGFPLRGVRSKTFVPLMFSSSREESLKSETSPIGHLNKSRDFSFMQLRWSSESKSVLLALKTRRVVSLMQERDSSLLLRRESSSKGCLLRKVKSEAEVPSA